MTDRLSTLARALDGKYVMEREVGRGGMATVYLARDLVHQRLVALKVLNDEVSAAVRRERFRREIDIAQRLDHPNILPVYDWGEAEGCLYYVMPFVEGQTLRDRLDKELQLPIEDVLQIASEVASALDYAHDNEVVHRDIKPENILLSGGRAVVADFGVARALTEAGERKLTQTGVAVGTPTYMSPEQGLGTRGIDGRSDQYALACVVYETLTGQPPFTGITAQQVVIRHLSDEAPRISVMRQSVPEHIEAAVMRALEKSPADRFRSAGDFAAALREPGRMTIAQRMTLRSRSVPSRKRTAQRVWMGIAGAAVLVAATALATWQVRRPRSSAARSAAAAGFPASDIAILYFDDVSRSRSLGSVADGLTESLIDELGRVEGLRVISRNGVAPFRGREALAEDSVAKVLRVGTIVRGEVDSAGGTYRLRVRLVDGNAGVTVSNASLEAKAADALSMRASLAESVANLIRKKVGDQVVLRERRLGTENDEAWLLLHRAERLRKDAEGKLAAKDTAGAEALFAQADSVLAATESLDAEWAAPVVARGALARARAEATAQPLAAEKFIAMGLEHADRALGLDTLDADALELRGSLRFERWRRRLAGDTRAASRILAAADSDLTRSATLGGRASAWAMLSRVKAEVPDLAGATDAAQKAYEADAYLSAADEILWRLYATAYDGQDWQAAARYCADGYRRFGTAARFVECRLYLMAAPGGPEPRPDSAWRYRQDLEGVVTKEQWPLRGRRAQMLVAAVLARANQRDSAVKTLEAARGDAGVDPNSGLLSTEAMVRATVLNDIDGALDALRQYFLRNPQHRAGMAKSQSWWWRELRKDPRFATLVGTTATP